MATRSKTKLFVLLCNFLNCIAEDEEFFIEKISRSTDVEKSYFKKGGNTYEA